MRKLVDAAIEMHSRGVFHWDIKANNIVIEVSADLSMYRQVKYIDLAVEPLLLQKQSLEEVVGYQSQCSNVLDCPCILCPCEFLTIINISLDFRDNSGLV